MKISDVQTGTPASIVYVTDTRAAVVVKRTPKRVIVCLVETAPVTHENAADVAAGDSPVCIAQGILDQAIAGTERVYTLREWDNGTAYGTSTDYGRLSLGHSVTRTDYRV